MYSSVQLATKYLQYYATAMNGRGHGMHSPFVFLFIRNVLHNGEGYALPDHLEILRKKLLSDKQALAVTDLGAGSRTNAAQKTISRITAAAAKPPKYSRLLYRLVRYYKPQTILELGTSVGLTTAYMACAHPGAQIVTVEGSSAILDVAQENFNTLNLSNIESIAGNFDVVLPQLLEAGRRFDLVFVDGNHRFEPTVRYFGQLVQHAHNDTILVFDDIHWSLEMEKAWTHIKTHPAVRCTIDIFFMGFVFFKSGFREKRDFTIRF